MSPNRTTLESKPQRIAQGYGERSCMQMEIAKGRGRQSPGKERSVLWVEKMMASECWVSRIFPVIRIQGNQRKIFRKHCTFEWNKVRKNEPLGSSSGPYIYELMALNIACTNCQSKSKHYAQSKVGVTSLVRSFIESWRKVSTVLHGEFGLWEISVVFKYISSTLCL